VLATTFRVLLIDVGGLERDVRPAQQTTSPGAPDGVEVRDGSEGQLAPRCFGDDGAPDWMR
jgi:hypothetical protein